MAHDPIKIYLKCRRCQGSGSAEFADPDGAGPLEPVTESPCTECGGTGFTSDVQVVDTNVFNDIIDKQNDIKEKVDEIMDKLNE